MHIGHFLFIKLVIVAPTRLAWSL